MLWHEHDEKADQLDVHLVTLLLGTMQAFQLLPPIMTDHGHCVPANHAMEAMACVLSA